MATSDAALMAIQAPTGVPTASALTQVSDPLIPPQHSTADLSHFFEGIYDLRPESHLSRLLKTLLGDSGVGMLRKKFTYQHLANVLATAHFYDLDRFFSDVIGIRRLGRERLDFDPYSDLRTADQWLEALTRDAAYRNRIEQFMRALVWGATPTGMASMASAILGIECRVYEIWDFIDSGVSYSDASAKPTGGQTYGGLDGSTMSILENYTYGQLESKAAFAARPGTNRNEFVVRPLRAISAEERYELGRVLRRFKPSHAQLTNDDRGMNTYLPVSTTKVDADSVYWQITAKVVASAANAEYYPDYDGGNPVEQGRPAFSAYQGEAWSYNGTVADVSSYVLDPADETTVLQSMNYRRIEEDGQVIDYTPDLALTEQAEIMGGRIVSDGAGSRGVVEREMSTL